MRKIEIVGSIRREKRYVGDLEILAVPEYEKDLFGGAVYTDDSVLDRQIKKMVGDGRFIEKKFGPRYKQLEIPGMPGLHLDLFTPMPEAWAMNMVLRTGPAEFSQAFVTPRDKGGALPNGHKVLRGQIHKWNDPLDLPTEKDLIEFVSGQWIPPIARNADLLRVLSRNKWTKGFSDDE